MKLLRRHFFKIAALFGGAAVVANYKLPKEAKQESAVLESLRLSRGPAQSVQSEQRKQNEPLKWNRLSTTDFEMLKPIYKVVVIGSGYGASVMAARLAEKYGTDVCILERGKEFQPGDYPTTFSAALSNFRLETHLMHEQVTNPMGLYNVTMTGGLDIVSGNGLGGGSNINASVILEPLPEVFEGKVPEINKGGPEKRWPLQLSDFRPYYKKVRSMLRVERYRQGTWIDDENGGHWDLDSKENSRWRDNLAKLGILDQKTQDAVFPKSNRSEELHSWFDKYATKKTDKMDDINSQLDRDLDQLPIAVNLSTTDTGLNGIYNQVKVPQRLCNSCGDCVSGCNVGAKNTLIMNYLPHARNMGAQIFTQVEVNSIENLGSAKGPKYRVHYTARSTLFGFLPNEREGFVDTDILVVAAGSIGSTRLLLRSQVPGGFQFSPRLGERFSGNGDAIYSLRKEDFKYNNFGFGTTPEPFVESNVAAPAGQLAGPCLTTKVDMRSTHGFMFQDSGAPSPIEGISFFKNLISQSLAILNIGYDSSEGKISLTMHDRPQIEFKGLNNESAHMKARKILNETAQARQAKLIQNPRSSVDGVESTERKGTPVSVHPLGGCAMGTNSTDGVVNTAGQVFQNDPNDPNKVYPGLYVTCGAALPTAVGANPSLTISAFAERAAAYLLGTPDTNDPQKDTANKFKII